MPTEDERTVRHDDEWRGTNGESWRETSTRSMIPPRRPDTRPQQDTRPTGGHRARDQDPETTELKSEDALVLEDEDGDEDDGRGRGRSTTNRLLSV